MIRLGRRRIDVRSIWLMTYFKGYSIWFYSRQKNNMHSVVFGKNTSSKMVKFYTHGKMNNIKSINSIRRLYEAI